MEALKIDELPKDIQRMLISGKEMNGDGNASFSLLTPIIEEDVSGAATSQPLSNTPTMNFMALQITPISGKPGVSLCAGPVTVLNGAAVLSVRDAAGKDIMYLKVISAGTVKARMNVNESCSEKTNGNGTPPSSGGDCIVNAGPGK